MSFTKAVIRCLVSKGIVPASDSELYEFGLNQLFFQAINIVTDVIVGLCFGMLPQCILFLATFIPMRSYAGGFHAKTPFRCYILSTAILAAALCVIKFLPATALVCLLLAVPSGVVSLYMVPVADANKPLSLKEKSVYRKNFQKVLCVVSIVAFFCFCFGYPAATLSIGVAMVALAIMMVAGYLKNKQQSVN